MATKNCPKCSKQVPVACKKCVCGHIFFLTRRGAATASTASTAIAKKLNSVSSRAGMLQFDDITDTDQPRRRTGRVQREKPKFYDALQYENQMRKESSNGSSAREFLSVSDPNPIRDNFLEDVDMDDILKEPSEDRKFTNILVTVGTTSYDNLVNMLFEDKTLFQFLEWRTKRIHIQIGDSSVYTPGNDMISGIHFQFFRYKDTLAEDIDWADLIISHAGAGTTLDALDAGKTLLVIPNTDLMDNHQVELADHLNTEQFAFSATFDNYLDVMQNIDKSIIRQFPTKNPFAFGTFLNNIMDFDLNDVKAAKADLEAKEKKKLADEKPTVSAGPSRKARFTL